MVELVVNLKRQIPGNDPHGAETTECDALDLDQSYPCPVCRYGTIKPITLTEAWGCDRCRQIFERRAESNTIGKLSSPYNRQRNWRWDGKQWVMGSKLIKPRVFNVTIAASLGFLLWLVLSRIELYSLSAVFLLGMAVAIVLLAVIFWALQRR